MYLKKMRVLKRYLRLETPRGIGSVGTLVGYGT